MKKEDESVSKDLLVRLDSVDDILQLKIIEMHEQRSRILAETLATAKIHTVS